MYERFLLQLVTAQCAHTPQHKHTALSPLQIATICNNNCMYIIYGWNGNPKSTAESDSTLSHYVSIRQDGMLISDVILKKGKCFNRELTEKNIANAFYGKSTIRYLLVYQIIPKIKSKKRPRQKSSTST